MKLISDSLCEVSLQMSSNGFLYVDQDTDSVALNRTVQ